MLVNFTFQNFMSFLGKNTLSMLASDDDHLFETHTFTKKTKENEYRLLKSAITFGANASGKTNVLRAVDTMKEIVISSHNKQSYLITNIQRFLYSTKATKTPVSFEIEFFVNGTLLKYGFEINKGKISKEYLYKNEDEVNHVFFRSGPSPSKLKISDELNDIKHFQKNLRPDSLFLSLATFGNNKIANQVYNWFKNLLIFIKYDDNYRQFQTPLFINENNENKNKVLNFLQKADRNIANLIMNPIDERSKKLLSDSSFDRNLDDYIYLIKNLAIKASHPVYDENGKICDSKDSEKYLQSAGTRRMLEISSPIISAIEGGYVVLFDELDSRLSPKLSHFIFHLFNTIDVNKKNAQLICNVHNLLFMDTSIRKDQIYFVDKNDYGVSKLYSLFDFKDIKKNDSIIDLYMLGAFGAIPIIKDDI